MILIQRFQMLQIYKLIYWQHFLNVSFYLNVRDAWVYLCSDMFYNLRLGAYIVIIGNNFRLVLSEGKKNLSLKLRHQEAEVVVNYVIKIFTLNVS